MNTKNLKTVNQFVCSYCKKNFRAEKTLVAHSCRLKVREQTRNEASSQLAFYAYQRFYLLSQGSASKTWEQFANSTYYPGFLRFANYVKSYNIINPHLYVDWVIKKKLKLEDWAKDSIYEKYLLEILMSEPADQAVERTLRAMQAWADENSLNIDQYFYHASSIRLTRDITSGAVSPWLLYGTEAGRDALASLNEEQLQYVIKYIEPNVWQRRIVEESEQMDFVRLAANEAGFK